MRLKPEKLFLIKKQRVLMGFFVLFFSAKKKEKKRKKKHSESRKRCPPCRLERHGFKRESEER